MGKHHDMVGNHGKHLMGKSAREYGFDGKVWESLLCHHFPTRSCVSDVCENDGKGSHHFRVPMFTGAAAALRAAGRASRVIYTTCDVKRIP